MADVYNNHGMAYAAGLSYYFMLSIFPMMILLASIMAYLPVPNLFNEGLLLMDRFVPPEGMGVVRGILADVVLEKRPDLLTFGIIGTIWAASTGFAALSEALNIAYDVPETRSFLRVRLVALGMMLVNGALMTVALAATVLGPKFGERLAERIHLDPLFAIVWPYTRWAIIIVAVVLATEIIFYWGPNVKQRFRCTLPGAVVAVGGWIGASQLLAVYLERFAEYNKTYGSVGAVIVLMLWFFVIGLVLIFGAEFNAELLKHAGVCKLPMKEAPTEETPQFKAA
jgi:membrane protein